MEQSWLRGPDLAYGIGKGGSADVIKSFLRCGEDVGAWDPSGETQGETPLGFVHRPLQCQWAVCSCVVTYIDTIAGDDTRDGLDAQTDNGTEETTQSREKIR